MISHIDLEEAKDAIESAKAAYSELTNFGFGVYRQRHLSPADRAEQFAAARDAFKPVEVAMAITYLRQCRPIKTPHFGSYGLKHDAERWCRANGVGPYPYVSNGALIAAAHYCGFPVLWRPDFGPNARIGMSMKSNRELRKQTSDLELRQSYELRLRASDAPASCRS